jgi:hypothetical protein
MSYPTKPAFVVTTKGWDELRVHPAMAWMEKYTYAWDGKEINESNTTDWHTEDHVYQAPNGEVATGSKAAVNAALATYAPFAAHMHEPNGTISCWETQDGWEMLGQATLFIDLPVPGGPKTKKDLSGRAWDIAAPGMFQFSYVKDKGAKHDGIKMKLQKVFSDSGARMIEMIKRGMVKPEQLLG